MVSSGIPAGGSAALSQLIKDLAAFEKANPGSIIAVEGLNEVNIQAFSYNGSSSMEAAARFQKDLYSALKADATLKNVSVYNTTIANDSKAAYAASATCRSTPTTPIRTPTSRPTLVHR